MLINARVYCEWERYDTAHHEKSSHVINVFFDAWFLSNPPQKNITIYTLCCKTKNMRPRQLHWRKDFPLATCLVSRLHAWEDMTPSKMEFIATAKHDYTSYQPSPPFLFLSWRTIKVELGQYLTRQQAHIRRVQDGKMWFSRTILAHIKWTRDRSWF